jgi:hypothetical protein
MIVVLKGSVCSDAGKRVRREVENTVGVLITG